MVRGRKEYFFECVCACRREKEDDPCLVYRLHRQFGKTEKTGISEYYGRRTQH